VGLCWVALSTVNIPCLPQQCTKPASALLHHKILLSLSFLSCIQLRLAFMVSSSDGVRCTLHDGSVWLHLAYARTNIPPQLLHKSKTLMDAVSSVSDPSIARGFTLAAPKEWLRAWLACYGSGEQNLAFKDSKVLLHCLMVCFCT
jgi:hypothetical protein